MSPAKTETRRPDRLVDPPCSLMPASVIKRFRQASVPSGPLPDHLGEPVERQEIHASGEHGRGHPRPVIVPGHGIRHQHTHHRGVSLNTPTCKERCKVCVVEC